MLIFENVVLFLKHLSYCKLQKQFCLSLLFMKCDERQMHFQAQFKTLMHTR